jgi:opacity protein-like surface antigen
MRKRLGQVGRAGVLLAFLCGVATPASADWLLTPYLGITFGGGATFGDVGTFDDNFERKVTYGVNATWMGAGIIGFEVDLGTTPNFFENTSGIGDFDWGDSNMTTLMGNLIVGAPIGGQSGVGLRPYGSVGIGLLRSQVKSTGLFNDLSTNDLGFNAGVGTHIFFSDSVGLRGDIRYFRGLQSDNNADVFELGLDDLDFWRGTVGVTFRFGR